MSFHDPEHTCHTHTGRQRDTWPAVSGALARLTLSGNDILRVGVGEPQELVLVQIHDKQLVSGRELHSHFSELPVKVASISAVSLEKRKRKGVLAAFRK